MGSQLLELPNRQRGAPAWGSSLFQTGRFGGSDSRFVWYILIGSSVGLLPTTQSRLCVSVFWALGDTRTPMRFATLRVALTAALGGVAVFPAREWLGLPREWLGLPVAISAAALTASAGLAGWIEFLLIRFALQVKIVAFCLGGGRIVAFCAAAIGAAAVALGTKWLLPEGHPVATGAVVRGIYLAATWAMGAEEARRLVQSARPVLRWLGL